MDTELSWHDFQVAKNLMAEVSASWYTESNCVFPLFVDGAGLNMSDLIKIPGVAALFGPFV